MGFLAILRARVFGPGRFAPERLYFVVRTDLSEGRRASQLLHAMDNWTARFGPQQGTVIVYGVPDEEALEALRETLGTNTVVFHEPDLGDSLTALATSHGPLKLPLLGSKSLKRKRTPYKSQRRQKAA